MVLSKKIVFASEMKGFPDETNFRLEEEELSEDALKENEILIEALYLSVDPYVRIFARLLPLDQVIGATVMGEVVAKVLASKCRLFNVGDLVLSKCGWCTHAIVDGLNKDVRTYPLIGSDLCASLALGTVGMPGATAYYGLNKILEPKPKEVVVVNAAAGAVGSIVGQMAKIKGCVVVGYAGSEEKVEFLKELGFDHAFNYKTVDLAESLLTAAPGGVDCFFDNVGGEFASIVIKQMNEHGRVCVCGAISQYNAISSSKITDYSEMIILKRLRIQGILINDWPLKNWYEDAFENIIQWIKDGKIKYKETVTKGIENSPAAFIELLRGVNIGKAIVQM